MRYSEVMRARIAGTRQELIELPEPKRRQDAHDIRIMREVKIQTLVQGEGDRVVVERGVDLAARVPERVVLQPGERFLHVPDADGAAGGRCEGGAAGEVEVEAVFEAFPLGIGEEVAEG